MRVKVSKSYSSHNVQAISAATIGKYWLLIFSNLLIITKKQNKTIALEILIWWAMENPKM